MSKSQLPQNSDLIQNSPLWQRVPGRDANGNAYCDFMMLFPGFNKLHSTIAKDYLNKVHQCLHDFDTHVVYVDFNSRLNLLWISHKPRQGITNDIALAIQQQIPGAKLIAAEYQFPLKKRGRTFRLTGWIKNLRADIRHLMLTRKS